jgi:cytochrome c oxidase subunit 2
MLLVIIFFIAGFVLVIMAYTLYRFSAARHPQPSRTTHNTLLEVLWTVIPVLILLFIAIPSIRILYAYDRTGDAEMTIKAIGHQWYWSYEYPDHGNFTFDAMMKFDEDLAEGEPRLLATDNPVVLPADTRIRVQVTADDVLHSWAVPSFFNKVDAVPGRLNELLIEPVTTPGTYYGQCSELCGVNHSYMPIEVRVVPKDEFETWVQTARETFARVDDGPAQPVDLAKAQ